MLERRPKGEQRKRGKEIDVRGLEKGVEVQRREDVRGRRRYCCFKRCCGRGEPYRVSVSGDAYVLNEGK